MQHEESPGAEHTEEQPWAPRSASLPGAGSSPTAPSTPAAASSTHAQGIAAKVPSSPPVPASSWLGVMHAFSTLTHRIIHRGLLSLNTSL